MQDATPSSSPERSRAIPWRSLQSGRRIPRLRSRSRQDFTWRTGMLSSSAVCAFRTRPDSMNQNPPFPTPEELQAKLSEFMKSNFGDKVSFATFAQPERAEESDDEKPVPQSGDHFVFDFLPRDIKAHLDRFVIKQDEAKKVLSIAVCDHYNHVNYLRQLKSEDALRAEETE